MLKLEKSSLTSADTIWSALSWNISGQISRRRKRSPMGNGQSNGNNDNAATCQDASCDGLSGLLWERHQNNGDTVDFSFVPGTFTSLNMTDKEAGLYVPDDVNDGIGAIESHSITVANDLHYIVCMFTCPATGVLWKNN